MGLQSDGGVYELDPLSRRLIERRFPGLEPPYQMFVGYPKRIHHITREEFERVQGSLWRQIALMITGLTDEQMEELGGFRIYDPRRSRFIHDSLSAPPRRRRRSP